VCVQPLRTHETVFFYMYMCLCVFDLCVCVAVSVAMCCSVIPSIPMNQCCRVLQ